LRVFILAIFFGSLCIPWVSADIDAGFVRNLSNASLAVPTTGSAQLGTKESMTEYQGWLDECAYRLTDYSNIILGLFGFNAMDWGQEIPVASPDTTISTTQTTATPTPTPAIPESSRLTTIAHITGGSGSGATDVIVNSSYWELWYSVDPLVTGGQDSHSATGSNSAIFPAFSIQITDKKTGRLVDTIEPPGGLDITLWQKSGDPRPWTKKYYSGNREYVFTISGRYITSYTIEARIPKGSP